VSGSQLHSLELKELVAFVVAVVGGSFALWRWIIDQRWRRVQHAQSLIREFLTKPNTNKAFEIIDTEGEGNFDTDDKHVTTIEIKDAFLIEALSTFDQKQDSSEDELVVREIFDEFFEDLNGFQHHVDSRLIKLRDVAPYLEYWMRALTGRERVRNIDFARQCATFLTYFGYRKVLVLAESMKYPFPQKENPPTQ